MFLSGGGVYEHADLRRTSIAGAVQFAAAAQLQGIILHTSALQDELHMVEAAHNRGLRVSERPCCGCRRRRTMRLCSPGLVAAAWLFFVRQLPPACVPH